MEFLNIGVEPGRIIPSVGLGTWKIPKSSASSLVFNAILGGIRHFDCACDYGNEREVGEGIKKAIDDGVCSRSDLFITSKLWNTYHAKQHVEQACKKSLEEMSLSYFDSYLIHFPIAQRFVPFEVRYPPEWVFDPSCENPIIELDRVPIAETWRAMEGLVATGLAVHIGVCNFTVQSLMDLLSYAEILPSVNQIELHPYLTQQPLVAFCQSNDITVTAFSPLGSSSYVELEMDGGLGRGALEDELIRQIAKTTGKTAAQVILRWHLQRGVVVIPKSCSVTRVLENKDILDFSLSEEQMEAISRLNRNIRFNDP
eukprot:gene1685-3258_t